MEIAIALSGGGYRATAYHLGVLSYLNHLKFGNSTLLDHVRTFSTVSGGSLAGLWYVVGEIKQIERNIIFHELLVRIKNKEVLSGLLDEIKEKPEKGDTLITELADVYDRQFFNGEQFGLIMDAVENNAIHHFTANATDTSSGLPFRFQATKRMAGDGNHEYGYIGNKYYNMPRDIARQLRLADVLAASSCFPGIFEPIVIPDNFHIDTDYEFFTETGHIGLLDGGILDNLGINSILRAESQLHTECPDKPDNCIDMVIVSDASESRLKGYSHAENGRDKKTLEKLFWRIYVVAWLFGIIACVSFRIAIPILGGVTATLAIVCAVASGCIADFDKKLSGWVKNKVPPEIDSNVIGKIPFGRLPSMFKDRASSLLNMSESVVMAYLHRLSLDKLYGDKSWNNRILLNAENTLTNGGKWENVARKYHIRSMYNPSDVVLANTYDTVRTDTTLWFTDEQVLSGLPEKVVACGQYTLCWNLIMYIKKLRSNTDNTNQGHQDLMKLERKLIKDWKRFNENPLFMAKL